MSNCGAESEGKWLLTWHEDIRPINHGKKAQDARKECWDGTGIGNNIGFWECHTQGGNQLFKYIPDKHQIFHVPSNGCATADEVRFSFRFVLIGKFPWHELVRFLENQLSILEFLGVTQTDFSKTHPNMDKFSRNRSSSCPDF